MGEILISGRVSGTETHSATNNFVLGLLPEAKSGSGTDRRYEQLASVLASYTVRLAHIRTLQYTNGFLRMLGV